MENYWKQLKPQLESGIKMAAENIAEDKDIFRIDSSEDKFTVSLLHESETVVNLSVVKSELSIDLHTVLRNGKELTGSFEVRNGHLASVNTDSIYFADAGHAASNFLKPVIDALYDPPFNIPKR